MENIETANAPETMKTYVGVKVIQSKPMTRGEYNTYRGWNTPENENPEDEGYLVKYPDGYESWSPKKQFEEAYLEVGANPLFDTVVPMRSADYKERFKAEYYQVVIRIRRLIAMCNQWDKGELDFTPTCPRSVYNLQIKAMSDYITALEARAAIEDIIL